MTPCARCNTDSTSTIRTDKETLSLCQRCSEWWFKEWMQEKEEFGRYKVMSEDFHGNFDPTFIPEFELEITGK